MPVRHTDLGTSSLCAFAGSVDQHLSHGFVGFLPRRQVCQLTCADVEWLSKRHRVLFRVRPVDGQQLPANRQLWKRKQPAPPSQAGTAIAQRHSSSARVTKGLDTSRPRWLKCAWLGMRKSASDRWAPHDLIARRDSRGRTMLRTLLWHGRSRHLEEERTGLRALHSGPDSFLSALHGDAQQQPRTIARD